MTPVNTTRSFQLYQVCRYGALVLTGIILAKSGFDAGAIGLLETIILISGVTSFFWLNGMLNTYVVRSKSAGSGAIVSLALTVAMLTAVIITGLILFRQSVTAFFVLDTTFIYYLIPFIIFNNFSFITEHYLLVKEKARLLVGLALAHILLVPAFVLIAVKLGQSVEWVIIALTVFLILKNIYLLSLIGKTLFSSSSDGWKTFFFAGLPLSLSFLFGGISVYADGIMVNYFYSKADFAIYQYGAREFPLAMLLANAFAVALVKYLSVDESDGLNRMKSGSRRLWNQLFPLGILLMAGSKYIFPIVFNEQFTTSYIYFNIYLLLIIPRLLFPQSVFISRGWTRLQLNISIAEFVINIGSSLLLMQWIGLPGIAFGTLIAYFFEKLTMAIILNRRGIPLNRYTHVNSYLLYSLALVGVFLITTLSALI